MIQISTNMMQEVAKVFVDVQTELLFFGLALGTHLLFFSKLGFKLRAANRKVGDVIHSPKQGKLAVSSASLSAFKSALRMGDVKCAMTQFEELHGLWQQHESPSSAPHTMMEQFVKLAGQNAALPEVLQLIDKLGVVAKALDLVLAESANKGDAATLKQAEQLGRTQGVKFTAATYQALIKGASNCGTGMDAQQFMIEAQTAGVAISSWTITKLCSTTLLSAYTNSFILYRLRHDPNQHKHDAGGCEGVRRRANRIVVLRPCPWHTSALFQQVGLQAWCGKAEGGRCGAFA
jgi:hypothetical protein